MENDDSLVMRRRAVISFLTMASASALAYFATPRNMLADSLPKVELEEIFPKSFGSWLFDGRSQVTQVSPEVRAALNKIYNQTLVRTYHSASGSVVMLSVAYGGDQSDALQVHLPEVCYPAQGFEVTNTSEGHVRGRFGELSVRRLAATLGSRHEHILYWTTIGTYAVTGQTKRKLIQMKYGLNGQLPDGFLIRASLISTNSERAYIELEEFISELLNAVSPATLLRLAGINRQSSMNSGRGFVR